MRALKFKNVNNFLALMVLIVILVMPFASMQEYPSVKDSVNATSSMSKQSTTISQETNFTFFKSFNYEFSNEEPYNFQHDDVETVVNDISSFTPSETTPFTSSDVGQYYLSVIIKNATIFDDHDGTLMGAGEIFFKINVNNNETVLDNGGSYYSLNDGESVSLGFLAFEGWTNSTLIYIEVWESDYDADDYLGSITIYGVYDFNWTQGFITDEGDGNPDSEVYISANVTNHRSVSIDAEDLALMYRPEIYLDDLDFGDEPESLYYRVLEGYDSELGDDTICIQYLYYWPVEKDNFGLDLGHYYDFSPVFLYIEYPGAPPYRIVFQMNNPGVTALPARLTIYSDYITTSATYTGEFDVSDELKALLGETCTVEYDEKPMSDVWTSDKWGASWFDFPIAYNPILMVTDSYHNLELGPNAMLTTYIGWKPLTAISDDDFRAWYILLNESFYAPLHDYSWNNYEVPENMSLTIDALYNPFQMPYIVDCFENVTHQNRYARENENADLDATFQLNATLTIPAIIYVEFPSTAAPGEKILVNVTIDMLGDEVELKIDHLISINATLRVWFIDISAGLKMSGSTVIQIPLDTIQFYKDLLGVDDYLDEGVDINPYASIDYLHLDPTLLGTIVNASVSIHILEILKTVLPPIFPPTAPILSLISFFVEKIDLNAQPILRGFILGEIEIDDPSIATTPLTNFVFDSETDILTIPITISQQAPEDSQFTLKLKNIVYALNFTTDWNIIIDFKWPINLFVSDPYTIYLGTYPNEEWNSTSTESQLPSTVGTMQTSIQIQQDAAQDAAPVIDHPDDITYEEGTIGHTITWNPSDTNPDSYIVTRNVVVVKSGYWNSSDEPIIVSVDGLSAGTYTYTCTVNDTAGQSASDSVTVTVTSPPEEVSEFPWSAVFTTLAVIGIATVLTITLGKYER